MVRAVHAAVAQGDALQRDAGIFVAAGLLQGWEGLQAAAEGAHGDKTASMAALHSEVSSAGV